MGRIESIGRTGENEENRKNESIDENGENKMGGEDKIIRRMRRIILKIGKSWGGACMRGCICDRDKCPAALSHDVRRVGCAAQVAHRVQVTSL